MSCKKGCFRLTQEHSDNPGPCDGDLGRQICCRPTTSRDLSHSWQEVEVSLGSRLHGDRWWLKDGQKMQNCHLCSNWSQIWCSIRRLPPCTFAAYSSRTRVSACSIHSASTFGYESTSVSFQDVEPWRYGRCWRSPWEEVIAVHLPVCELHRSS